MLGASLAIQIYRDPVTNLEDVLKSDYRLVIAANSSIQDYFSDAPKDSIQGLIWSRKLVDSGAFIKDTLNFTHELANGQHAKTLFFDVFQTISGYGGHYPCQIEAVRRQYRKIDNGMVFQKHWPFTKLFNHYLLKLRERGVLHQIQSNYLHYTKEDCGQSQPREVGLVNIVSLLTLLISGLLLATAIFACEYLFLPKLKHNQQQDIEETSNSN